MNRNRPIAHWYVSVILIAAAMLSAQAIVDHRYFYDDAGQLSKVVDSSGNVVEYVYDAAGNIVQINRSSVTAGALAAFNFTPQRGPVGTAVTIQGQNFNSTPNLNTVRFNGVNATVVSASATTLVALVPSGATTGALTVQIGANTVTAGTFTVTTPTPAETPPTVSISSPTNGAAVVHGQTLTIAVSVSGPNPISAVDVSVNGFFFRTGIPVPFTTTFTVPYGVTSLILGARARDTLGNLGVAAPITVNVITDPKTTVQGAVVDSANAPISGASVAVKQNSLKGEYFYFPFAISSMPSLTGLTPDLVRPVSAIDFRNTDAFFSNDTFGLGVTQNFAARFTGNITIATAGTYTFTLGAATGGKLLVNGNPIAEVTNVGRYAEASGTVTLSVGTPTIEVQYFNGTQIAELQLSYLATGAARQIVPSALLTPAVDVFTGTTIAGGTFSIANVPVALGAVRAKATFGALMALSASVAPVPSGITNVGTISLRTLFLDSVAAGLHHNCGTTQSGQAYCWGLNIGGQLGDGTNFNRNRPVAVAGALNLMQVSGGTTIGGISFSCGVSSTNAGYCWGTNGGDGRLGDGTTTSHFTPGAVSGGLLFGSIVAGVHACGVTTTGTGYCWGENNFGQVGDSSTTNRLAPSPVSGGLTFASISAGNRHSCGVTTTGAGYCWGRNTSGQLGITSPNPFGLNVSPVQVANVPVFSAISASGDFSCGIASTGAAWCWGVDTDGRLGNGPAGNASTPVTVSGGHTFTKIAAGRTHVCAIDTNQDAWCWGNNSDGRLGNGTTNFADIPVMVSGGLKFVSIAAGESHSCGTRTTGVAYCWGGNASGQLGTGNFLNSTVPVVVVDP